MECLAVGGLEFAEGLGFAVVFAAKDFVEDVAEDFVVGFVAEFAV